MKDNRLVKAFATVVVWGLVAPVVINGITIASNGVINGVRELQYRHKIKNGLKDGTIVKINGEYYEVQDVEEA